MSQYGTYDVSLTLDYGNTDQAKRLATESPAIALEAAASGTVGAYTWVVNSLYRVKRIGYHVTVAFDYATQVTEGVIAIDKRVTVGSDTDRVEVARIDLEDGLAIDSHRVLDVPSLNSDLEPGDQLVLQIVTAGTGGGASGDYRPFIELVPRAEVSGNITGLSLSTLTQVV